MENYYYAGCDTDGKVKIFKMDGGREARLVGIEEWCKVLDSCGVERGNLVPVRFNGGETMEIELGLRDIVSVIEKRLSLIGEKRKQLTKDLEATVKDYEETCQILDVLRKWRQNELKSI